ncbi:MAG: hypothetical protein JSU77_08405 [Fidelibacterota bacterium]|nr:MAG: hypothetical protein JSU77_08405 [Candidatus Neomarinimicrobiota bacterium]
MRKLLVGIIVMSLCFSMAIAGGIVTNTNQSAQFIRTLNRNASVSIDAAYFNPAGLIHLEDGLHFSLSNQSILQTREVISNYAGPSGNTGLNDKTFTADVQALLFPDVHLVYKTGPLAFFGSFMPIGGGGSADYGKGLPSFEMPVSDLVPKLVAGGQSVTGYRLNSEFKGASVYTSGQVGAAYEVNSMISIAVGARVVSARNTYKGHLKDIEINMGQWVKATDFFTGAAALATSGAAQADNGGDQYTAGAAQATAAATLYSDSAAYFYNLADATTNPILKATYTAAGDAYTLGATQATTAAAVYADSAEYYYDLADSLELVAVDMGDAAVETADKEVDVEQTGIGFTPIVGIHINPMDGLHIGIRYEHITKLELTNKTKVDGSGLFPDGEKTNADMPAMLGVGVSYQVMPALRTEASFNYYLNTGVDWDGKEADLDNGLEAGLALEYALSPSLLASAGFLTSIGGAKEAYQRDLSYSLNSTSVGLGVAYTVAPNLVVNIGAVNTFYSEGQRSFSYEFDEDLGITVPVVEKYNKTSIDFAIGIDYSL